VIETPEPSVFKSGMHILTTRATNEQEAQLSQRPRLVLTESGRMGLGDDILRTSSTTVTESACKGIEFGKKTQNKSSNAVQGYSRSPRSAPIKSP